MVSLDKCSGSCNSGNDLFIKICVPSKTKGINVKAFNVITRINIFHVIVNANSIVQLAIQSKNRIMKYFNVNVKIIVRAKKIIVGILAHVFARIASI